MWKVLLEIRTKGQGSFWKKGYKGKGSLIEWEEREGLNAKRPLIPFLPSQNRGRAPVHRWRPDSGALGLGGGRERGGKGKGGALVGIPASPWVGVVRRGGAT